MEAGQESRVVGTEGQTEQDVMSYLAAHDGSINPCLGVIQELILTAERYITISKLSMATRMVILLGCSVRLRGRKSELGSFWVSHVADSKL